MDNPFAAAPHTLARECLALLWTCALLRAVDGSFGSRLGPADYRPVPLLRGRCSLVSGPIPQTRRNCRSFGSQPSRRHVAIHLSLRPDEDDAVPGGIASVPLHLLVGHRDARAARNHALAVGDNADVVVALDLERVRLEGVPYPAAA